jgi:hypothetical protein
VGRQLVAPGTLAVIMWAESAMELILRAVLLIVVFLVLVLVLSPYEAWLEGVIAVVIVGAVLAGFLIHPRREIFHVRTSIQKRRDKSQFLEHDFLAIKVELARLWLLFLPTFLAVAFLVFFVAGGPVKFSYTNWIFSSRYAFIAIQLWHIPPLLALLLAFAWISERRVMRDAEACSARSFSFSHSPADRIVRISYLFMGEHGEYYGGSCLYFGLVHSHELATIVFYNVRKPELNKIATGFLFHRLILLGRGVTDLDRETVAAQTALAETTS